MNRRDVLKGAGAVGAACLGVSARASADFGVTDSLVRVGQSAVFSGPSAGLGQEMRDGIKACFSVVNRAGGVNGRALELVSLDDGYEPDRAASNTRELIEGRRVFGLLGYVGTPTSNAALPIFTGAGVPFVGAFTGTNSLRTGNRWVFNVRASYLDEGVPIVRQLTSLIPSARIAIFVQHDAYGTAVRQSIEKALSDRDLAPVVVSTVERNATDAAAVARAVDEITRAGAQSVAMGSVYAACTSLVEGLRARGSSPMFASVSFVGTTNLLEKAGASAQGIGISQVMPDPMSGSMQLTRDYQQAMATAGLKKLSYGSIEGYVAAMAFVRGLERAGAFPTREKFVRGMEAIGHHDFGGFAIDFSATNHNGSKYTEMTVVGANGRLLR